MLTAGEHAEDQGRVRALLRDLHRRGARPVILIGASEPVGGERLVPFAVLGTLSAASACDLLRVALAECERIRDQAGGIVRGTGLPPSPG